MNYKELKNELQNTLPKKNSTYQFIKVNYYPQDINKDDSLFRITWENQGENFGTIADIKGTNVTFYNFNDIDTIKIIMNFVNQDISEKLDLPKSTKLTHFELNAFNKLFQFFDNQDRFTKLNSKLNENDIQSIEEFIKTNQKLFK